VNAILRDHWFGGIAARSGRYYFANAFLGRGQNGRSRLNNTMRADLSANRQTGTAHKRPSRKLTPRKRADFLSFRHSDRPKNPDSALAPCDPECAPPLLCRTHLGGLSGGNAIFFSE